MTATEQEDLENLLRHPGWLYFKQHAEKQIGDELASHMRVAVNDTNDVAALQKMRQLIVAKDAVERLMKWPDERIGKLKGPQVRQDYLIPAARGGYIA